MKSAEWYEYQNKTLVPFYENEGICYCEYCGGTFALSFHHLVRRSHGGKNELSNIMLLCAECHHKADNAIGHVQFNAKLILIAEQRPWNVTGYFDTLNP